MTVGGLAAGCAALPSHRPDVVHIDTSRNSLLAREANAEGICLLSSEDVALAKHKFEAAIRHDPSFAPAHNNLGQMAYTAGDMATAAAAFDAAIQINPNNPVPHNNLGLALENGGRPDDAVAEYAIAHQLQPDNPIFLGNLLRAQLKLTPYDESLVPRLRELRFLETRPDWKEWIDEQLAIRFNPYLDRGPSDPDLSELDDALSPSQPRRRDLSDSIIEAVEELDAADAVPSPDESDAPRLGVPSPLPPPSALPAPQPTTEILGPAESQVLIPDLTPGQTVISGPAIPSTHPMLPPSVTPGMTFVPGTSGPTTIIVPPPGVGHPLPPQTLPPLAPPIDWFPPVTSGGGEIDSGDGPER